MPKPLAKKWHVTNVDGVVKDEDLLGSGDEIEIKPGSWNRYKASIEIERPGGRKTWTRKNSSVDGTMIYGSFSESTAAYRFTVILDGRGKRILGTVVKDFPLGDGQETGTWMADEEGGGGGGR